MSFTNLVKAEEQKKRRTPRPLTPEQQRINELTDRVNRLLADRKEYRETLVAQANAQLAEKLAAQVAHDQKVLDEQTAEQQAILDTWAENLDIALVENEALRARLAEVEAAGEIAEAGKVAALQTENERLSKEVERLQKAAALLQRRVNHLETELSLVDPGPVRGYRRERRPKND